jgi:hypothetical protein
MTITQTEQAVEWRWGGEDRIKVIISGSKGKHKQLSTAKKTRGEFKFILSLTHL